MPEGTRRTPTEITLEYKSYSKNVIDGYHIYTFYIKGDSFLDLPLDANVRLPSEKSIPFKDMVVTLEKKPKQFFLQNSGMSIIASKVSVSETKRTVILKFPPNTGIVNGGHTQLAILTVKKERDISDATVRLEVMEHSFDPYELATIASSRNTASNVKPYSTAEKKGFFVKIKNEMLPDFEKHIIWYENREVPNDRGLLAVDLIARLNLFNIKNNQSEFTQSTDQPNKSATSKTSVFKDWESNQDQFHHTYPLVNDIINLEEHILSTFYKGLPKGFTTLKVVKKLEPNPKSTIFLGKEIKWELPKQFLLPILASFRAVIKYDKNVGKIGWYEKPEDVFDKCKKQIFEVILKTYKSTYHNEINRASKDANLWQILYMNVQQQTGTNGQWKELYAIPK